MKKNDFNFENKQIDSFKYQTKLAELQNFSVEFSTAINVLKENKLPTDEQFIKDHLLNEMALRLYLNDLAEKEIKSKGGFLIEEDIKESILRRFKTLFENIKVLVSVFDKAFTKGFIKTKIDDNGELISDDNFNEKTSRLYAEYFIDGTELSKYHELCLSMHEQRKKLRDFESKHGITVHFSCGELITYLDTFGANMVNKCAKIDDYFQNDNPDEWLKIFGSFFKSNGIEK